MQRRTATAWLVFSIGWIGFGSLARAGQIYDLAQDWSITSNPNGPWAYGLLSNSLQFSPFMTVVNQGTIDPGDFSGYQPSWFGPAPASLMKSTGVSQYDFPVGSVGGHTPLVGSGDLAVQWTAPQTGTVDLSGGTWMWRDIGRSEALSLFVDGNALFSGVPIPSRSSGTDSSNPFTLADALVAAGGSASSLTDISIQAGDTITLATSAINEQDFVGINFTIQLSSVPEPSALTMGGVAALCVGIFAICRRCRRLEA